MYDEYDNQLEQAGSGFVLRVVSPILCVVAWVSAALVLSTSTIMYQVAAPCGVLCSVIVTGFLLRAALMYTDKGPMPESWRARWMLRARRSFYPLVPIIFLPVAQAASGEVANMCMLFLLASSVLLFCTVSGFKRTKEVRSLRDALRDPFDVALGVMTLVVGVQYLSIAHHTEGLASHDAAYYFGMARRIVAEGSFDEPLVWHYLVSYEQVVHPGFDYWSSALPVVMTPALFIFGNTERVANMTNAFISFVSVALFWYVLCVAVRLRHGASRFIALVLFAYMPAMSYLRFCPDTVPLAQIFALLILVAFIQKRFILVMLAAFLLFLTRGDTVSIAAAVWVVALLLAWKTRRFRVVLIVCFALAGLYVLRNFLTFGTITPPGASQAPFLESYLDLYTYRSGSPHLMPLSKWFSLSHVLESGKALVCVLQNHVQFFPNILAWCTITVVAWFVGKRSRRQLALTLTVALVLGLFATHFVAGKVFSPVRTLHVFDPLLILVGALGFDAILELVKSSSAKWVNKAVNFRAFMIGLVMMCLTWVWLSQLSPYGHRVRDYAQLGRDLEKLDVALAGDVVASDRPWYFLAYTHSPAIMIPANGSEAIEAAMLHYRVKWLIIHEEDPSWISESRLLIKDLVAERVSQIGCLKIQKVSVEGGLHVFRVMIVDKDADHKQTLSRRAIMDKSSPYPTN